MYENWQIETTLRCNLKCRHCLISDGIERRGIVEDNLRDVISRVANLGGKSIGFTGGEPFMARGLVGACIYARSIGISPSFITNSQIVSNLDPDIIADTFEVIGVSIEGTHDIHDYVRGKGTYVRATKFIRNMVERDAYVVAYIVVNNLNILRLSETLMNLINMGVRAFHINQLNIQGNAAENSTLHLNRPYDEIKKLVIDQISEVMDVEPNMSSSTSCDINAHSLYLDRFGGIHSCVELGLGGLPPIASLFDDDVEQVLNDFFATFQLPACCAYEMYRGKGLTLEYNLGSCPLINAGGEIR